MELTPWVDKLVANNKAYEALTKESYDETAAKTELKAKETRTEVDKAFRKIAERIEALIVLEGETDYAKFVRRLNVMQDKYANILAQPQGRNAKKRSNIKKDIPSFKN